MDLNDEAIAALKDELKVNRQAPGLTFQGAPADCAAAVKDMQSCVEV